MDTNWYCFTKVQKKPWQLWRKFVKKMISTWTTNPKSRVPKPKMTCWSITMKSLSKIWSVKKTASTKFLQIHQNSLNIYQIKTKLGKTRVSLSENVDYLDLDDDSDEEEELSANSSKRRPKNKRSIEKLNVKGETALHRACIKQDISLVRMLLQQVLKWQNIQFLGSWSSFLFALLLDRNIRSTCVTTAVGRRCTKPAITAA